ncbi:Cobalamin biosynthesis bifunctional protein CbiET [Halomicronema hongdechloris C2206]|uniref:Cobalamin biosynthesis bifunctional protein CbiET n=1 Tax=Halomicronema hongdechloris C2206 TaxID=1641165 RepID=A0A1Z3HML2_9CYAN|nr:precorrin-6y C5,15-methyltransferase (decarboxylating) subunit CbiE [Halomicronema hongdechloris]ASC71552.1 Cobalamin biosynthesis bifunctional protein CbiET [Halomicronema hongdechloris C2206]
MIHVVGIGLDGLAGLSAKTQALVAQAQLLVGAPRHLAQFADSQAERWPLDNFRTAIEGLRQRLASPDPGLIVVLASGDPLFFGIGRLLLESFPAEQLSFHPHLSAIQLAFSRIKRPWQGATLVSAHGRSRQTLVQALQRGDSLIAVLTDGVHRPDAIARLLLDIDLPGHYHLWVCENLGGEAERVQRLTPSQAVRGDFAPLNVVILERHPSPPPTTIPDFGIPDGDFLSFEDRPGLITKREVRLLVLGELAPQPHQVIWDIGAGTGSVSIELGRLVPTARIYAIEKTAMGATLIRQNLDRFGVTNVTIIHGKAPTVLADLPAPHRIFIGGSGGQLTPILDTCRAKIVPPGPMVLALATLESQAQVLQWQAEHGTTWRSQLLQVNLARSTSVGCLTRWHPLNPVTIVTLTSSEPLPA